MQNKKYHIAPSGSVEVECIRCKTLTPLWGGTEIRIGKVIPIDNPNFMKQYNGSIDLREKIYVPKVKKGIGCRVCVNEWIELSIRHGNKTFIKVKGV